MLFEFCITVILRNAVWTQNDMEYCGAIYWASEDTNHYMVEM